MNEGGAYWAQPNYDLLGVPVKEGVHIDQVNARESTEGDGIGGKTRHKVTVVTGRGPGHPLPTA